MIPLALGNQALNTVTNDIQTINTNNHKIVPWSYYFLGGCAVVGAIIAVAGYVLSQMPVLSLGLVITVIAGLGAYEIKSLSLTKRFEQSVVEYRGLNDQLNAEINRLNEEKENLDGLNHDLQTKIEAFAKENKRMEALTIELKSSNEKTESEISLLKIQGEEFQKLEQNLRNNVETLISEKDELEELNESQVQCVELLKDENKELEEEIKELETTIDTFKEQITKFKDENKTLLEAEKTAKVSISMIKQETEEIQNQNKQLKESLTKIDHENDRLKNTMKKKEEVSNDLEITVRALEEKVVKKMSKMVRVKEGYEQKIKDLQLALDKLIEENKKSEEHVTLDEGLHHSEATFHLLPKVISKHTT